MPGLVLSFLPNGKKDAKPVMYIDWIRVYTNRDYKGENPPAPKYY